LRAGPLSNKRVIQVLNDSFINTWVLKPTLPSLRDTAAAADKRELAKAVLDARQKGSPVDCVVLSPDLKLISVRPFHDLLDDRNAGDLPARYRRFLTEALEKAKK
jgi:hypothetical protein